MAGGAEPLTDGHVYRIGDALEAQADELDVLSLGVRRIAAAFPHAIRLAPGLPTASGAALRRS